MAYSAPSTISTGDLITAAKWNADVSANPIAIYAGAMSVTSQAVGDILYASSTTQFARIAAVATGQVLTSAGTGTVPAWSSNVDLGGTLDVTGATTLDSTLTVVDDLAVDTDTLFVDASADKVAIGTTAMDGLLHIQSASAGTISAHANADELVLENSAHAGMTILAGKTSNANIFFGDEDSSTQSQIYFSNNETTASLNIQNEFGYVNLLPSGGGGIAGVGISTSVPLAKTHIYKASADSPTSGSTSGAHLMLEGTDNAVLNFGQESGSPYSGWIQQTDKNNYSFTYPLALNPSGGDVYSTAWTDYYASSTIVGWSSLTSGRRQIMYRTLGDMVWVAFHLEGTSDATTISFTVPYTSATIGSEWYYTSALGFTYDNGGYKAAGRLGLPSNSNVVACHKAELPGGWTATGTKIVSGQFWYQKA